MIHTFKILIFFCLFLNIFGKAVDNLSNFSSAFMPFFSLAKYVNELKRVYSIDDILNDLNPLDRTKRKIVSFRLRLLILWYTADLWNILTVKRFFLDVFIWKYLTEYEVGFNNKKIEAVTTISECSLKNRQNLSVIYFCKEWLKKDHRVLEGRIVQQIFRLFQKKSSVKILTLFWWVVALLKWMLEIWER